MPAAERTIDPRIRRIRGQLRRAYSGEAWHGPSVTEVLRGVNAAQAAARPSGAVHSIWEIVLHIAAWKREVLLRLNGGYREEPEGGDWRAPAGSSEEEWKHALEELDAAQQSLVSAVSGFPAERLAGIIPEQLAASGVRVSYEGMLDGLVQHDVYHAGQIAVLKKL